MQATASAPSPVSGKRSNKARADGGGKGGTAGGAAGDPSLPTPRTLTMHAKFLLEVREVAAAERKFNQVGSARCPAEGWMAGLMDWMDGWMDGLDGWMDWMD